MEKLHWKSTEQTTDCTLDICVSAFGHYQVEVYSIVPPCGFSMVAPSLKSLLAFMLYVRPHAVDVGGESEKDARKLMRTLRRKIDPACCRLYKAEPDEVVALH